MIGALRAVVCFAVLLAGAAGCATDDTPTGSGDGGTGSRVIKASPSFSADIQEIFDRRGCSNNSCHGNVAQAALDLRAGKSWAELWNVQSFQPSPLVLVRPAHAQDSSYLVDKLDGTGSGLQMPNNGTGPLDSIDMQNIINWIHMGAANN